jgi:V8-like Glu-specific endopeptidase
MNKTSQQLREHSHNCSCEKCMNKSELEAILEIIENESGYQDIPFRYICKINMNLIEDENTERLDNVIHRDGTGFLIGPNLVMTAAHVVIPFDGARIEHIDVIPGARNKGFPFDIAAVRNVFLPRDINFQQIISRNPNNLRLGFPNFEDALTDYAILQTNENFENSTGFWGQNLSEKGVGHSKIGALNWREGRYSVSISGYRGNHLTQSYSFKKTLTPPREAVSGFLYLGNDIPSGKSGSPVWVRRDRSLGGYNAVGITFGEHRISNRIFKVARLIDATVLEFINAVKSGATSRNVVTYDMQRGQVVERRIG